MTVATILGIGSGMDVLDQEACRISHEKLHAAVPQHDRARGSCGRGIRKVQADSARAYLPAHRWSTNNIFNCRRRTPVR